jgi:hypothetical protein
VKKWQERFFENKSPEHPENFPFMVIGNKTDKED